MSHFGKLKIYCSDKALEKYHQGEMAFKPFLLAAVLKKMHDSLMNVDITDHREVLSYFGKLNKISYVRDKFF
jgi:hypothetical protein